MMSHHNRLYVSLAMALIWAFPSGLRSEPLPPDVMIARFRDDLPAAVSLTFDDALDSHAETAVPILDRYGLKGTFFLLIRNIHPDRPSNWGFWRQAVKNGHEAGSHSITHPLLTRIPDPHRLNHEILSSADRIEEKTGVRPTSFAYPESDFNDAIRRQVLDVYAFDRADCRVWGGDGFQVEDGIRHLEQAFEKREWFYCMLHGVGEQSWGTLDPELLDRLAAYLAENRHRFWVDTYSRVSSYIQKRNHANITLRNVRPESFDFRLSLPKRHDLERLPPIPLTVKIALEGHGGARSRVRRGRTDLDAGPSACGRYLMLEVEPDGQWIHVAWNG